MICDIELSSQRKRCDEVIEGKLMADSSVSCHVNSTVEMTIMECQLIYWEVLRITMIEMSVIEENIVRPVFFSLKYLKFED